MSDQGFRKVGHKTRRGRKSKAAKPHGNHRTIHALNDPLTRAVKREKRRWMERDRRRFEAAAE